MAGYIVKVERVHSPKNSAIVADLCMDKRSGKFFADVGGERVQEDTKEAALEKVVELLGKVSVVAWREVIVLRVYHRDADEDRCSRENELLVFTASCSFTYFRRERAPNPIRKKETMERDHRLDFEERVKSARARESMFERDRKRRLLRMDEVEREMRDARAALVGVREQWSNEWRGARGERKTKEFEIPYTDEAWAGLQRIAQALRDTQVKLDGLAQSATPGGLAALVSGDVFKQLPAAK